MAVKISGRLRAFE